MATYADGTVVRRLRRDEMCPVCNHNDFCGVTIPGDDPTKNLYTCQRVRGQYQKKDIIMSGGLEYIVIRSDPDKSTLVEELTDGTGHGKTQVGVDVDLADGKLRGLAQLLFGNAHGIRHVAAVLVDHLHVVLRNGRGTVQNDGEVGKTLLDFLEDVETQEDMFHHMEKAMWRDSVLYADCTYIDENGKIRFDALTLGVYLLHPFFIDLLHGLGLGPEKPALLRIPRG